MSFTFNELAVPAGLSDAFGRLRVSDPETIFDSKQIADSQPLLWEDKQVYGAGGATTTTHDPNKASTTIAIGAGQVANRTRQTYMRFNYQPGKSQLIFMTGTLIASGGDTGVQQGWGFGDNKNGIFLRHLSGTISLLRRSYRTGSTVTTSTQQNTWNLDTMDGTGPSGVTLDFTKSQIFVIDFEWLGVGRMRCGFVVGGAIIYCHEFTHANEGIGVYMSTPNLPLRYWIQGDGNQEASSVEHICASVISEGGIQKLGSLRHQDTGQITSLTAGNRYVLMSGELKTTHQGISVDVENVSLLIDGTNKDGHWEFIAGGTLSAGSLTYNAVSNSAVNVAIGNGTQIHAGDGVEIDGGYASSVQAVQFNVPGAVRMGADQAGTSQRWYLTYIPNGNTDIWASVTWRELL